MNKLANIAAPQPAAKSVLPVQAPNPQPLNSALKSNADNQGQSKSFGDMLARHVSEANKEPVVSQPNKETDKPKLNKEEAPHAEKVSAKSESEKPSAQKNTDATSTGQAKNNSAEPQEAASAQSQNEAEAASGNTGVETAPAKKITAKSSDEIFSNIKAKKNDADAASANGDAIVQNFSPEMLATLIPLKGVGEAEIAASGKSAMPDDLAALAKPGMQSKQTVAGETALSGVPGEAKNLKDIPELGRGVAAANQKTLADVSAGMVAKKDDAFSNLMEKLSMHDEKGAALAAAPQPNANVQAAMQTATATLAAPSTVATQITINTPVTHDKWGEEFNEKITWLSGQKEQTAELHLNPPQLGPMDVVLKVSGDQATALFTSHHAAVREAIEQALPKLREMMAESGIMLGNATVSDQAPRDPQGNRDGNASERRSSVGEVSGSVKSDAQSMRVSSITRHNGIVDTFV